MNDYHQTPRGNGNLEPAPVSDGLEVVEHQYPYEENGIESSLQKTYNDAIPETPQTYHVGSKEPALWQRHQKPLPQLNEPSLSPETGRGRPWVLILALACAVTAIVVGAAVGGGLGASLARCQSDLDASRLTSSANQSCPAAPQTPTDGPIVNYKAEPASRIANLSVDCANLAASIQVTQAQEKFLVYCGVDFKEGPDWTNRDGDAVVLADLLILIAYSVADCLQACSQYTFKSKSWDRPSECGSVTFKPDIGNFTNGNCWLKNSTVTHNPGDGVCDDCISATKIS